MKRVFVGVALLCCSLGGTAWATDPYLDQTREIRFQGDFSDVAQTAHDLGSAVRIYEYLLNEFDYLPYYGVRSGARNTLWRKAGNDVDLAALLIAMLRSQGIRARYATGTITMSNAEFASWLAVPSRDEAVVIMAHSVMPGCPAPPTGASPCIDTSQSASVSFPHVWVEALLPVTNYRGIAGAAGAPCTSETSDCKWIALDPSFKAHQITAPAIDGLNAAVYFDYRCFYNAIKPPSDCPQDWQNKNPADVLQEQILAALLAAHSGAALPDVLGSTAIVPVATGIMPGSLPYQWTTSTLHRYASAAEHDGFPYNDLGQCAAADSAWTRCVTLGLWARHGGDPNTDRLLAGPYTAPLDRLTGSILNQDTVWARRSDRSPGCDPSAVSCDLIRIKYPSIHSPTAENVFLKTGEWYELDAAVAILTSPNVAYHTDLHRGTTYLLVAGGIETNATQVAQASNTLLGDFGGGRVEQDQSGSYYVDVNANGVYDAGIDYPFGTDNVDTLDLLAVAARQYAYGLRLLNEQISRLTQTRNDPEYDTGFVSSQNFGIYVDGSPFATTPAGLLIDVKGFGLIPYRYPPYTYYPEVSKLFGHAASALEHEVWQQLTSFDAVSTVRSFQKAIARGGSIMKIAQASDLPSLYTGTGFLSAPDHFAPVTTPLDEFATRINQERPAAWSPQPGHPQSFALLKQVVNPALLQDPAKHGLPVIYYGGYFPFFADAATTASWGDSTGAHWVGASWPDLVTCLASNLNTYQNALAGTVISIPFCLVNNFHGTVSQLRISAANQWAYFKGQYNAYLASIDVGVDVPFYLDQHSGFVPGDFVYRTIPDDPATFAAQVGVDIVTKIRNDFSQIGEPGPQPLEFQLPTQRVVEKDRGGHVVSYGVYYEYAYDGAIEYPTYHIDQGSFGASGGYVVGETDVTDSTVVPSQPETVIFDNASHTDQVLNPDANNSPHSSSTGDPVSTATGNMFHEETDFTIPAQPFDFVFTRTYNSRLSRMVHRFTSQDSTRPERIYVPLGPGWTHSYAMLLIANDFGASPNAPGGINTDGKVSSVTFVDEHGGEYNFPIDGGTCPQLTTCTVSSPTGFLGTLKDPTSPTPSIEFPDGTRYTFMQTISMTDTNGVAVLSSIEHADGRRITIYFGGLPSLGVDNPNRTETIYDQLGRSITLQHYNNRLAYVTDGHNTWSFGYDGPAGLPERLTSVTNPLGYTTRYNYHIRPEQLSAGIAPWIASGVHYRLDSVLYPPRTVGGTTLQRSMTYDYYTNGWAASTRDALGNTEQYTYDLFRRQTAVTDPRGFTRTHINDARGALQTLLEADGNVLNFKSQSDNLRYEKRDAYGRATQYSYAVNEQINTPADRAGNVTMEHDPADPPSHYTYTAMSTASGRSVFSLTQATDKSGIVRSLSYCPPSGGAGCVPGKLWKTIASPGTTTEQRSYFSDGTLQRVEEPLGDTANPNRKRVTEYTYNTSSHLRPDGKTVTGATFGGTLTWSYGYDPLGLGRLTSESLDLGANSVSHPGVRYIQTSYGYDALGRVTSVTRPDASTIYTDFDEDGNPWRVRGDYVGKPERILATRTFDAAGRKTTETDTLGHMTQWTYDEMGNVLTMTDANNHTTSYEYDAMGRRTRTIDPNGNELDTHYDAAGNVDNITTPAGTTQFEHDAVGRLTKTISPLNNITMQGYDGEGRLTSVTDPNVVSHNRPGNSSGQSVTNHYDPFGRLDQITDATHGTDSITKFEYDLLGDRTAVVDPMNNRTEFAYNDLGQLYLVKDPLGNVTSYQYDTAGQVYSRTDRNGRVTNYFYDRANRLMWVDFADTNGIDEVRQYDPFGNLQSIQNKNVTYTFTYDELNRRKTQTDSRTGKSLAWSYDNVGNIIGRTGYEGDVTTYTYDSANRLVGMSNPDYLGATYHYDAAGRLMERILTNGARTLFDYDDDSRLIAMTQYSADGTQISTEQYCLDGVGNILYALTNPNDTCVVHGNTATGYTYDDLYRLKVETLGSTTQSSYNYDAVGNIQTASGDGDSTAGNTYHYDAANRLNYVTDSVNALLYQFDYDPEGNRTAKRDANGNVLESYAYDEKNRMITFHKTGQPDDTHYTYDPFDYRIGVQTGNTTALYALDGERIDAIYDVALLPQATFLHGAVIDEIVGAYTYAPNGQRTFTSYAHDRHTSVIALADHTGHVTQTYSYGPFGADRTTPVTGLNHLKYTGREQDASGLYYYRARYYDPATRRFMTEDPLGFDAGINFYTYVGNNPNSATDPSGKLAPPYHFAITAYEAWEAGYSIPNALRLGWDTAAVDFRPNSQSSEAQFSNGHAMAGQLPDGTFQSVTEAIPAAVAFINQQAQADLPAALHAGQDLAAPWHTGFVWQGYNGTWDSIVEAAIHAYYDSVPGTSVINDAANYTRLILQSPGQFQYPYGQPANVDTPRSEVAQPNPDSGAAPIANAPAPYSK